MLTSLISAYVVGFMTTGIWLSARNRWRVYRGELKDITQRDNAAVVAVVKMFLCPIALPTMVAFCIGKRIADKHIARVEEQEQVEAVSAEILGCEASTAPPRKRLRTFG
jgi:hypothetical protein